MVIKFDASRSRIRNVLNGEIRPNQLINLKSSTKYILVQINFEEKLLKI